jgi:hypothetical protein
VEDLRRLTRLVLNQVSHWTQPRWGDRGDGFFEALQRLAGPERALPRLSDVVLPDQLRVLVDDIIESEPGPAEISRAVEILTSVRGTLTASR